MIIYNDIKMLGAGTGKASAVVDAFSNINKPFQFRVGINLITTSIMAYKQCVFDGCRSRGDTPGRTLFIFPLRDPDRLQQWLEVTGCTVQDLDQMARHVCDLHFHSKYFSNNPRRKVLVGQAVPFRPSGASSSAVPDVDTADGAHLMDEPDGEEEASEEELLGVVEELELNEDEELGEYVVDSNDHIDELVDEEMGVTEEEQSASRKDNPTDNGSGDQNASKSSARKDSKPVASQAPSLKRPRQEVQEGTYHLKLLFSLYTR